MLSIEVVFLACWLTSQDPRDPVLANDFDRKTLSFDPVLEIGLAKFAEVGVGRDDEPDDPFFFANGFDAAVVFSQIAIFAAREVQRDDQPREASPGIEVAQSGRRVLLE